MCVIWFRIQADLEPRLSLRWTFRMCRKRNKAKLNWWVWATNVTDVPSFECVQITGWSFIGPVGTIRATQWPPFSQLVQQSCELLICSIPIYPLKCWTVIFVMFFIVVLVLITQGFLRLTLHHLFGGGGENTKKDSGPLKCNVVWWCIFIHLP